jgi:hypothetical protein
MAYTLAGGNTTANGDLYLHQWYGALTTASTQITYYHVGNTTAVNNGLYADARNLWYAPYAQPTARSVALQQQYNNHPLPAPVHVPAAPRTAMQEREIAILHRYERRMVYRAEVAARRRVADAEKAKRRAERLLVSVLTREQRRERREHGYFTEIVSGHRYRFYRGTHGNVHRVNDAGETERTYCIQPDGVPEGDAHAAQLLLLRTDAERFMRVAGVRNYDPMPNLRRVPA